jgi:hypothetical protein
MKKAFLVSFVALTALVAGKMRAQNNNNPGGPANVAGNLYASNFASWTVPQGNTGPLVWSYSSACNSATAGGVTFKPMVPGTPIRITDSNPTLSETVTVTSVSPYGSGCQLTVTPSNPHQNFFLSTADAGLQEAINFANGRQYVVILTSDWARSGGTDSMINNAKGNFSVSLLDERTSVSTPYLWNGTTYVATPYGGGASFSPNAIQFATTPNTAQPATAANVVSVFSGPCTGTNVLQANGQCGPGGSGALPAGIGTSQFANIGGTAFASGGTVNTDVFGGAVSAQAATCTSGACTLFTPPTSTDTEQGEALPSVAGKPISTWADGRGGAQGLYATNPNFQNSSPMFVNEAGQALHPEMLAYTGPYPGPAAQGTLQVNDARVTLWNGPGYSNGDATCTLPAHALFCPQPQYTGASEWANYNGYTSTFIFRGAGIKGSRAEQCFLFSIGDGQCGMGALFSFYGGGCVAPSDECGHMGGENQIYSVGDAGGTIATITDPSHIKLSGVASFSTFGQGRFIQDFTTVPLDTVTHSALTMISADLITQPQFTGPPWTPGTLVTNESSIPVSTASGTLTNDCTVPIQDGGTAIGQNSGANGCAITVTHGTFLDAAHGGGLVCMAYPFGNEFNIGIIPTGMTALSGGHQTLTGLIHRSVKTDGLVYQGGTCSMGALLGGDFNFNGQGNAPVIGSLIPQIGSTDAHTSVYINYNGSQIWQTLPNPGSQFGTKDTGNSPGRQGFVLNNLVRTAGSPGLVTATVITGFNTNPPAAYILNTAFHFSISGCSDATMNTVNENHVAFMPGPNPQTIEYQQNGAASTCASAIMAMQNTFLSYEYIAELYDVANHAPGISPIFAADGTLVTSAQPNFVTGDAMDSPTHYAGSADGMVIADRIAQPLSFSAGLVVDMINQASYTGQAIQINSQQALNEVFMTGGAGHPGAAVNTTGSFDNLWHSDTYPAPTYAVIAIDQPSFVLANASAVGSFGRNFNLFALQGNANGGSGNYKDTINYDADAERICYTFAFGSLGCRYGWGPNGSFSGQPAAFVSTQYEGSGQPSTDWTQIAPCAGRSPAPAGVPQCYQAFIPQNAVVTTNCTGGSCTGQYLYQLVVNDVAGISGPKQYQVFNSWATLTGGQTNTLPCSDVPPGETGTFYLFQNTFMLTVGTCSSPSTVLTDSGTYGAAFGPAPLIAGKPLYSGAFVVPGVKGFLGFTQLNTFGSTGTIDSFNVTASISQTAAGVLSVNGATTGDGQGTLKALELIAPSIGPSTAALWTSGTSDPTGACSNGSLYSNSSGAATHVFWVCVASSWVNDK